MSEKNIWNCICIINDKVNNDIIYLNININNINIFLIFIYLLYILYIVYTEYRINMHGIFTNALLGNIIYYIIYALVNFRLPIKVYKHSLHNYIGLYYRF